MKPLVQIIQVVEDFIILVLPKKKKAQPYRFAFIVHPRNRKDIERKFPIFKFAPDFIAHTFTKYCWPITVSKVVGLKSVKTGGDIEGYIISVLPTARQMMENRNLALKRILQACKLAEKKGARIVGLGGLTSSLSKGGIDLLEKVDISITTGHAYTSYNVTQNVISILNYMGLDRAKVQVAVVGAAGSVGSTSVKILTREGFSNFLLVDLERKLHLCDSLKAEILNINPHAIVNLSHQVSDIKNSDLIIAATNAPEALIQSRDLKWGAIIVDDAQPSDVHEDVFLRKDVLVLEAGVTHTPHIRNNFNFGLKNRQDNFCCLAEVLILAANEWNEHYVINRASMDLVDHIASLGEKLNFRIGNYQNFNESISDEKLVFVRSCIKQNELTI